MIAYKAYLRNKVYRSEVWLRVFGNISIIFIQISIWKALLGKGTLNGIDLEAMITYSLISTFISMILMSKIIYTLDDKLKSGNITSDLLKPLSYPLLLFFDQLGNVLFQVIFTMIPTLIISWLLFGLSFPTNTYTNIAFAVSVLLALLISFLVGYIIALVSFWFLTTFALDWMISALITVFSGSFLPLWFFSDGWRFVADLLPFQYLGFVPAAIYMEKIDQSDMAWILGKGIFWVFILWMIGQFLWLKAVKRLVIQGG
ncbi:ABC-2 family transporter protein [Paenibacillus sp. 1011MAR3C5]|uniref:ABC transporter permease n=1 Tax=Paenibacillus sp. 1011MAR3C5 TaxID=1675787 RepID=UPI001603C6FD|nr:ABC-2 family transporter protein [Paenibacillus sp. 1011MAR3C5]